jgi:hypothetical protein
MVVVAMKNFEIWKRKHIIDILMADKDFNSAVDSIVVFLEKHERWRSKLEYPLTIMEILHLYKLNKRAHAS